MGKKPTYLELEQQVKELEKAVLERKIGDNALKDANQEKETILDSLVEHVIYQDTEMRVLWANRAACESVNQTRDQILGRCCYEIWPRRSDPCPDCPLKKAMKTGQPEEIEKYTPDGRAWFIRGYPVHGATGKIVGAIELTLDITKGKQAEKALRNAHDKLERRVEERTAELVKANKKLKRQIQERKHAENLVLNLSQLLMQAQEQERQMISCELHDSIAQNLSTLKIGCELIFDDQPAISHELKMKMGKYSDLIDQTIASVRNLAYDLRPPVLDEMGLVRALETYCEEFSENNGLKVEFQSAGIHKLTFDSNTEIHLYRLVQEGLNNIRKHAHATRATIKMVGASPNIILRIQDDGKGFDVKACQLKSDKEKRMGLQSMRERVKLLQGRMTIQSRPMKGTRIVITYPFNV
ncbi:MAG: PAS domain-containing protein [Deltaproteobacteria bacterium]|nr:PAS domain-containing protein [Deltaproteobacteria bacterium]